MIGLYHPGTSLLHRTPAGVKVLVFAALTLAIALTAGGVWTLPAAGCLTAALYLLAGLGIRSLLRQLCAARWIVLVMLVTQVIFLPVLVALTNTGRVLIVIVLAALITLTTRIPALLDATERALAPFRRFGVYGDFGYNRTRDRPIEAQDARPIRKELPVGAGLILRLGWRTDAELGLTRIRYTATDPDQAGIGKLNDRVGAIAAGWIAQGKIVGVIGGDHSTPFGAIAAHAARYPGLGVLHLDAHADLRDAYEGFAGIAFISTDDGYAALPPGT